MTSEDYKHAIRDDKSYDISHSNRSGKTNSINQNTNLDASDMDSEYEVSDTSIPQTLISSQNQRRVTNKQNKHSNKLLNIPQIRNKNVKSHQSLDKELNLDDFIIG